MQAISYNFEKGGYDGDVPAGRPATRKPSDFGKRLGEARREAGLTQEELAERLGTSQRVVTYWERESVGLKAEQLVALADVLGVSVDNLLGRENGSLRRGGPVGRARRVFEQVNALPRGQQGKILDVVEALVAQNRNGG